MRELKIWSILMLAVMMMPMLTACSSDSSDDEGGSVDVSKAIGTWFCIASTDRSGKYSVDDLFVGHEVTIKSNNTYSSTSSSFGYNGTYQISGNRIIVLTDSGRRFVITVSFSGNRMTWNGSGEGVNFTYVFEREDTKVVSMPPVGK